jgi:hypothetical protein
MENYYEVTFDHDTCMAIYEIKLHLEILNDPFQNTSLRWVINKNEKLTKEQKLEIINSKYFYPLIKDNTKFYIVDIRNIALISCNTDPIIDFKNGESITFDGIFVFNIYTILCILEDLKNVNLETYNTEKVFLELNPFLISGSIDFGLRKNFKKETYKENFYSIFGIQSSLDEKFNIERKA